MKNSKTNKSRFHLKIDLCRLLIFFLLIISFTVTYGKNADSTLVKKVAQTFVNTKFLGHTIDSTLPLQISNKQTIGYVVKLKPEGYVVLSNNTDIYPIIFYSNKGNFDFRKSSENIPLDFVEWDLEAREKSINTNKLLAKTAKLKNNAIWNDYSSGTVPLNNSAQNDVYGPLLTTNWDQGGYFDDYCPLDPVFPILRSDVGCTATAAAQIINYWQFPKRMTFLNDAEHDRYTSRANTSREIKFPDDANNFDFPSFNDLNTSLSSIKYDGDHTEIGYLCFGVGIKLKMSYSAFGSGAYQSDKFFRDLGYGSASRRSWYSCYKDVIDNIEEGWPVQVSIHNDILDEHHSVVFDGYNSNEGSFHVNMGWSGLFNGWYIPPNIGLEFNIMGDVVYDICPYQGWSQWGADEKNSFRTPYAIPNDDKEKWNVQSDDWHSCNGLIVSKSSNIIISCRPTVLNSDVHPTIIIASEDGVKKNEIPLENENHGITYPVQNENGTIYVGTGLGRIYKIDPISGTNQLIFGDPTQNEINENLKIDDDGLIYAVTESELYCIDSTGHENWKVTAPANCYFIERTPAIDVARNKIYFAYRNNVNDIVELVTIDRINGNILNTKVFSNVTFSSGFTNPSIDNNGNVYIGCNSKLYILKPDNNYSLSELFDSGFGYIQATPALGKDGTLYLSYLKSLSKLDVVSFNPTNKNINWSIQFNSSQFGAYGNVNQIYVDQHNQICISLHYHDASTQHYTLYAYKDNGNSYSSLWSRNIGDWGGFVAFGPDKTLFYSNGNTVTGISELSQGQLSFPNYTNNTPPNSPTYSGITDGLQTADTSLTFSWNCSDSDGHSLKYIFYLGYANQMLGIYKSDLTTTSLKVDSLKPDSVYLWSVVATDGQSITQGPIWSFKIKARTTGINEQLDTRPLVYALNQNYPNPFNPTTTLTYEIPKSSNIKLKVYNVLGKLVKTLVNEEKSPGKYSVSFNAESLASGIYFYTIKAGNFVETKKMVLLK